MNIFELMASISLNTSNYEKGIKKAKEQTNGISNDLKSLGDKTNSVQSKMSSAAGAIGNALSKIAKIGAAAMATAGTAIVGLTKNIVSAYGDYEQLAGGVETLFKDSAETIKKYANEAYKTAGLSANKYMETATGFAASLIQSLDGDTAKATEYADRAIRDMSD